jgi:hypothetical protein
MQRMRVTILEPERIDDIIDKKDNLNEFEQHRVTFESIKPSDDLLEWFANFEYPEHPDNVIPMVSIELSY